MAYPGPRPVGLSSPAPMNRFGGYGATGPANGAVSQAAQEAEDTKWYESGVFWTVVFLFVGYILVYRTIR